METSWQQQDSLWFRLSGNARIIPSEDFQRELNQVKNEVAGPNFFGEPLFSSGASRRARTTCIATYYRPFERTALAFTWDGSGALLQQLKRWGAQELMQIGSVAFELSGGSCITARIESGEDVALVFAGEGYSEQLCMCLDDPTQFNRFKRDMEIQLVAEYRGYLQHRVDLGDNQRPDLLAREKQLEAKRQAIKEEERQLQVDKNNAESDHAWFKAELQALDDITATPNDTPSSHRSQDDKLFMLDQKNRMRVSY